ncbi:MAG: hypothetical protein WCO23_03480 [bacterium]
MKNNINMKIFIPIGIFAFVLIFGVGFIFFNNVYRLNNKFITGNVAKISSDSWGIETGFPKHKLSVTNLPIEFQKENTLIGCKISITDVIGSNDWDVYTDVSDCKIIK